MNEEIIKNIAKELKVKEEQVKAVLELLENDATVAFIARYRKEVTGGLDEEQIRVIDDEYQYGLSLQKRKDDVIRLIEEKGLMTDELREEILKASKLIEVEDLYRPYKEKKKTKATTAIALGLEPLADIMLSLPRTGDKYEIASAYITEKVPSAEEAITQAKYIVAEKISDNAEYRKHIREAALKYGTISCKKKNNELDIEEKYKNYYDATERLA
ncbi:MAG: RNA-binding transcriptional accessory protein, partial [Anaeroplasmataceae bacterium]|nr:RNA-binding transcriptional accessory protein [Anaeroplasmataceae bacterium]